MRHMRPVLLACALCVLSSAGAVELTRENYDALTAGKSVLIKLFAPWCTHCKAIKPAWDALMMQYEGHADVLVGESDCTAAGKTLCEDLQVQGYPTLKYGDPAALTDYQGARDLEGLKRFADSELRPVCSLSRLELCDEGQRERIEELQGLSPLELAAEIAKSEKELVELETKFKRDVEELQREYKELQDAKAAAAAAVRAGGLGLMRAVQGAARRAGAAAAAAAVVVDAESGAEL